MRTPGWLVVSLLAVSLIPLALSCGGDNGTGPESQNTAPAASFTVTPPTGSVATTFQFDASGCSDDQDAVSVLQVRWDWESDGTWDTGWSTEKSAQHVYGLAGSYNVTMEVRDMGGHTDNYTEYLEVEPLAIPELSGLVVPIVSFVAMFLVLGTALRRK